jgi:hypothetical protein
MMVHQGVLKYLTCDKTLKDYLGTMLNTHWRRFLIKHRRHSLDCIRKSELGNLSLSDDLTGFISR